MSDTPRTDAQCTDADGSVYEGVTTDFARTLERELSAVTRERDEARTKRLQTLANVADERDALRAEVERLTSAKDGAYEERNRCVALIARMAVAMGYRAGVAKTAIEGWSEDWHGCVYIDLPTGQASWHYHDTHAHLFEGLPEYPAPWDGHDTPEKYRRVDSARQFPSVRSAWVTNQLRQINDWCCYATEEDISARLMALQQIGVLTRAALQEPTP